MKKRRENEAAELPAPTGVDVALWEQQSVFRQRLYTALVSVPAGRVTTYGELGRAVACGCAQAVGQALRGNPFAPLVPCHRVVGADGRIGGFAGHRSGPEIARKQSMLRAEGVRFDAHGKVEECCRMGDIPHC